MCDARPRTRPGKLLAYHAVSGGFIIAEIVERVTGKAIRQVHAGGDPRPARLPLGQLRRRAGGRRRGRPQSYADRPAAAAAGLDACSSARSACTPTRSRASSNDPRFLTGIIPAGNVVTTANELSRFFELLRCGGELDGVRIMERPHHPPRDRRARLPRVRPHARRADAPLGRLHARRRRRLACSARTPTTPSATSASPTCSAGPTRSATLSVGLITSGKPILHPGLPLLWALTRRIGLEAPRS